ncbi:MAG: zinc ribbon domain-containing protein [Lachnospiraceae bacterium]|nr:zinc ribbon domain-containing protein [Lachnospiraceae bacterium]
MRICKKCQVEILDDSRICPLCSSVLELSGEQEESTGYPDVKAVSRKLNFVVRLYSFLAIITEAVLIAVNYLYFPQIWWSAISGISILYCYITLKYSLQKNRGYKTVIVVQVIGAVLLVIAADYIVGYRGWSVNYVLPGAILLLEATIGILMIVNVSNWQSYMLMQILTVLVSLVCVLFWKLQVIKNPVLTFLALAVSLCLLLGTMIFGERRAKAELKRRFHV